MARSSGGHGWAKRTARRPRVNQRLFSLSCLAGPSTSTKAAPSSLLFLQWCWQAHACKSKSRGRSRWRHHMASGEERSSEAKSKESEVGDDVLAAEAQ